MQSIHGIYNGKEIRPLEALHVRPNVPVIITFLNETVNIPEHVSQDELSTSTLDKTPTQQFLEKCGGWNDIRSPQEIVTDIYEARTSSERGGQAFQEASS